MARNATVETAPARSVPLRTTVAARAEAIPAWAWVVALVAASAGARFAFAANKPAPWIFPDSLVYGDLAKSFAASGHFALREVPGRAGFGVVYPLLLAPAYALFKSIPDAFTAMKAINCVLMSLAAIPTYLLARTLVGRWLALFAAALAVTIVDLGYTGTIMTENAFYPVFAFWCWLALRALLRPTIGAQLAALALIGIAFYTRPQAVLLVPALITTLVLLIVLEVWAAPVRRAALVDCVRRYATFWLLTAAAAVAYVLGEIVIRGKSWSGFLGSYSVLGGLDYETSDVGRWFLYHVGELAFAVAVLPFAALLVVVFAGLHPRRAAPELRAFAALALSTTFWLLLGVSMFATTPFANRILERSAFYVVPFFMVALVTAVGRGLIWTNRSGGAAAAVIAVGFVAVVPYASFIGPNEANDSFALLTLNSVLERGWVATPQLQAAVVAAAVIAALVFLLTPRRFALALPLVTLVTLALANGPAERRIRAAATESRNGGVLASRDWIDGAAGTTRPIVTALWSGRAAYVTLWDNEFFNRSVGKVYNFNGPPDGMPQETVGLGPSGEVTLRGKPLRARDVLADPTLVLGGRRIAVDPGLGMTVYRVDGPIVVRGQLIGLYPDLWSGSTATYTQYRCSGGTVVVRLTSDPKSHPFAQTVTATTAGKRYTKVMQPDMYHIPFAVPVVPKNGVCSVDYTVSPTAVPAQTIHNGDQRALGTRFERVVYRPPHGPSVANR